VLLDERKTVSNFNVSLRHGIVALAFVVIALAPPALAQTFSILHSFTGGADGGVPFAGLTIDQAGNFYGTTAAEGAGHGTVFKLTRSGSGWVLSTVYAFRGGADGGFPYARVVFGPDGALYGTTSGLGLGGGGNGTVFRLTPPSHPCRSVNCPWTETVLYNFTGRDDGGTPGYGDLAFDAAGNIYGTTIDGGCSPYYNCGVVFKLTRSGGSWTESVLHSFTGGDDGGVPFGGVILDSAGNVYGTAFYGGGGENGGVVFELTQSGSGWTETVLHGFGPNDGQGPVGGVIMDGRGNLYGTTEEGPGVGRGTVWELQPSGNSWAYTILAYLSGGFPGPQDALIMDGAGNLYATSNGGGSNGYGNVFKLTPSGGSWIYTDLHDFNGQDGAQPFGSVVLEAHGNLYSTTAEATGEYGEVWEITP
jgi:hypothetical protein